MANIAIHGFGRIGRTALRIALQTNAFVPVSISDIRDIPTMAALFAVDTNYGRWHEAVQPKEKGFSIGGRDIAYYNTSESLPDWGALGIDVVIDCTGRATTRAGAQAHLDKGAKRVLVSAASKSTADCDAVLLPGINLETYDASKHKIVSIGSCTTNALAPVVKILIENIIPSSSGAAKALKFIWSDLNMTGKAYRVPTRTGSIAEVNAVLKRSTTPDEIRAVFRKAASEAPLKGVMGVLEEEWTSSRIVGDPHSSIIDLPLVDVIGDNLVSVAAWYDNEYGFTSRLVEMAAMLAKN